MPDPVNSVTKLITLGNLETYTSFVEPKGVEISYDDYLQIPAAERASDNKTYYINDYDAAPANIGDLIFTMRQTLEAGETSLTFTNAKLNNNSLIQVFYPNTTDVSYTEFTQNSTTSFTLTFDEQESDILVVVLVINL